MDPYPGLVMTTIEQLTSIRDYVKHLLENDKEIRKLVKDIADRSVIRGDD